MLWLTVQPDKIRKHHTELSKNAFFYLRWRLFTPGDNLHAVEFHFAALPHWGSLRGAGPSVAITAVTLSCPQPLPLSDEDAAAKVLPTVCKHTQMNCREEKRTKQNSAFWTGHALEYTPLNILCQNGRYLTTFWSAHNICFCQNC